MGLIFNGKYPYDGHAPGYLTCLDENNVWDGTLDWGPKAGDVKNSKNGLAVK